MNFCYPYFPPRKAENILMSVFSISFLCALLLSFDICFNICLHIVSLCFIFHSIFSITVSSSVSPLHFTLQFMVLGMQGQYFQTKPFGVSYSVGSKTRQNLFVPSLVIKWGPEDFGDIVGFISTASSCKASNNSTIESGSNYIFPILFL